MAYSGGDPWRLVLLGKTGVGKSSTGNTILGDNLFLSDVRPNAATIHCSKQTKVVDGRTITILDTPGLYDSTMSNDFIVNECTNGIRMVAPGPHAFLLVIDVMRFTPEQSNTVHNFQDVFGEGVHKHMIILFTRGDDLEYYNKSIEAYFRDAPELCNLISACGNRYHVFNNRRRGRTQVRELFSKIQSMLSCNSYSFYSYELFTMARDIEVLRRKVQDLQRKHHSRCLLL